MSIKVTKITKTFGKQKALNEVNFSVKSGEIVGLLGPNGAGKSTLMKILTCYIPPTSGTAAVCNLDVLENAIEVRKKVGYLPENNPLYYEMYVREFLMFIAGIHKLGRDKSRKVDQMIEITGLTAERKKKIGALSKGYRQRVGLAQAMIHDPQVLILDEPTSGLDPNQILEIRELITKIGREKTVMLSTHIMQEVEAVCKRAVIINKGIIVADDLTENLPRMLGKRNVVLVEFEKAPDAALLRKIEGVETVKLIKGKQFEIHAKGDEDIRNRIFSFAVENKLMVLSMQKEESSMEDVFHLLTREQHS